MVIPDYSRNDNDLERRQKRFDTIPRNLKFFQNAEGSFLPYLLHQDINRPNELIQESISRDC